MHFLPEKLETYISEFSEQEPSLLKALNKETWQKAINPRMLSGAYQGRFLSLISKLIRPKKILEIGTFTGYSALCLAEGLEENGKIITIDSNVELKQFSEKYFKKSKFNQQIEQISGNALEILPTLNDSFDLIFMDADKENYANYFKLLIDKQQKGSVFLTDNVLWAGKVMEDIKPDDIDTQGIVKYNQLVKSDPRVETLIVPIRDGISISRVK